MMNRRSRGFLASVLMLTLVAVLALPTPTFAERPGRRLDARYECRAIGQAEGTFRGTFREIAKTNGYNDGKQAGINDRKRGQPSNFRDENGYQKATAGYNSKLGNKQ